MKKETLIKLMELFEDNLKITPIRHEPEGIYRMNYFSPSEKILTGEELKTILGDGEMFDNVELFFTSNDASAKIRKHYIDFTDSEFNEFVARFMEEF